MRSKLTSLIVLFAALVLSVEPGFGQFYFGKNKVQYTRFGWQVMTTEHFHIYFYEAETEVARYAADIAETAYRRMAIKFNHEIRRKIPLIIYSSPSHFSQTNIIPGLLPESVGGFTEFLKGRVVVPFAGSYFDFVHVINHEMVHVFQIAKLEEVTDRQSSVRYGYPPLWFIEGQAECWSKKWDTEADMIVKDMVISGQIPAISDLYFLQGTYFMYKLGESICSFVDSVYGPDKLVSLYENWPKGTSFEQIVSITLGDDINEVSRKWHYSLQKKYFPELAERGLPMMESQVITPDGYAVKGVPLRWDDGQGLRDWVVFKANRLGYTGLYMRRAGKEGGSWRTLVKGERSTKFESLHLLRSGIDACDSGLIVFSSQSQERDILYIFDLHSMKITQEFNCENLIAARSPRFSPDYNRVVFSGIDKGGLSNLYLLDLKANRYHAVTQDIYNDVDPTFTPDGSAVIFASDRGNDGICGAINLFRIELATGVITQLTSGQYKDQTPEATRDGIYFSSNRLGTFNLFRLADDGSLTIQSTLVTGAFDPRLFSDGKRLVFTGYQDRMFQVYEMPLLDSPKQTTNAVAADTNGWRPSSIDEKFSATTIHYNTDYSLDIAQSSIAYDPVYGSIGGLQAAISDVLGNRVFHVLLSNTARTRDQFLTSFNAGVTYVNRERQLNWGIGAYHLFDEYFNDFEGYYTERQAGVVGLFSYPFSKFQRIDVSSFGRYTKKDRSYGLPSREGLLLSNYASWIFDNALWDISGPIEGRRYNLTVGITSSITDGKVLNRVAFGDVRHYFRLGKYSALANRLFAFSSAGSEPQRFYLGGSWSFRGFSRRAFYNRNILFTSNELRFPLIDDLLIGFPIGAMGFQGIRGVLFFDTGAAWDDQFDRFYGSFGTGMRVNLANVVLLRFDFSRTTDYRTISNKTDFDFFFGWNF